MGLWTQEKAKHWTLFPRMASSPRHDSVQHFKGSQKDHNSYVLCLLVSWNECNVWERFGWRSLSSILSLLRWTVLLHEELTCPLWTCCLLGNDDSVTTARVARSRTKFVLIACNNLKDTSVMWCRPASWDDGSLLFWARFFTACERQGWQQLVMCRWGVPLPGMNPARMSPTWWHSVLHPIWGIAVVLLAPQLMSLVACVLFACLTSTQHVADHDDWHFQSNVCQLPCVLPIFQTGAAAAGPFCANAQKIQI